MVNKYVSPTAHFSVQWCIPIGKWLSQVGKNIKLATYKVNNCLQLRRKISRLQALFKIIHQDYSLSIPPHFISMTRSTRIYHPHRFILPNSSTYSYQQSFFSRSIKDWNNLPSSIIESNNIDSFSAELQTLYGTQ